MSSKNDVCDDSLVDSFANALIHWYHTHKENHFFRRHRTPYRVWISEVALQQTRLQAAMMPLKRFFSAFENLGALAKATEDQVLQAFQGLGYYNRARNLRRGAQYILEKYNGELPKSYEQLVDVPSIGPYTAAAISSICFGQKVAVFDGNVKRVLSRILQLPYYIHERQFETVALGFFSKVITESKHYPGDLNEALMELGQKICLKSQPLCQQCALKSFCQAQSNHVQDKYPRKKPKPKAEKVTWRMLILQNKQKVALQKPKNFAFLKGHYLFPSFISFANGKEMITIKNGKPSQKQYLGSFKHTITKYNILVEVYQKKVTGVFNEEIIWVHENRLDEFLVSSLMKKAFGIWQTTKPSC